MLIFMFSSVTLYSTVTTPTRTTWDVVEEHLERKTREMLLIANDHALTPAPCGGSSMLEQLVIDGARGDDANWNAWERKFFGPGYETSLFLDNGEALMPLHNPSTFRGVTEDTYYAPNMTYTIPIPLISTVSGLEDLPIEVAGIRDAHILRAKGEAIEYRVHYESTTTGIEAERATNALTAMINNSYNSASRQFVQDFHWSTSTGDSRPTGTLTAQQISGLTSRPFSISLSGGPNRDATPGTIPAGTEVTIQFPSGWSEFALIGVDWHDITEPSDPPGQFRLSLASAYGESILSFTAMAPDLPRPFEVIHARLENGNLGESTLVLSKPASPLLDRNLPRYVYATTPYPVRNGSVATFGVAFANGGDEVNVTQVDVTIPGGYDLAAHDGQGAALFNLSFEPAGVSPSSGSWSRVDGKHLRWTRAPDEPGVIVPSLGAAEWIVRMRVAGWEMATSIEGERSNGPTSGLEFGNEFESASRAWGASRAIYHHVVAPASLGEADGYPTDLQVHKVNASVEDWRAPIVETTQYRVLATATDVTSVQNAIANSSLRPTKRLVASGSVAEVRANIDSLATTLGALDVVEATVQLDMYSPITRGCPTRTWTTSLSALPAPQVTDVVLWDGGTGTPSVFAALADGRVHRVGANGATLATFTHDGATAKLAYANAGLSSRLFVVTDTGRAYAVVPATMEEDWSEDLMSGPGSVAPSVLAHDAARGSLLIGTVTGKLILVDTDVGSFVRAVDLANAPVSSIVVDDDGDVYALAGKTLARYDASLSRLAGASDIEDFVGFGVAPTFVAAGLPHANRRLDKDTLVDLPNGYRAVADTQKLGKHGDANGDGKGDLVLVDDTNKVSFVSGDDAQLHVLSYFSWTPGLQVQPLDTNGDVPALECHPLYYPGSYTSELTCGITLDDTGPKLLATAPGRTLVYLVSEGRPLVWVLGAQGEEDVWEGDPDDPLSTIGLGAWSTASAFATGSLAGNVAARTDSVTPALTESSPSERLGDFSYYMLMPEGGFYGAHVVVLTITWAQAGKSQSARLVDWFEVGTRDGNAVEHPNYRVALVSEDGALPIEHGLN